MLAERIQPPRVSAARTSYPSSSTPKTSADYIAYINNVKTNYLDAKWNADGGTNNWYTTNSMGLGYYVPYTWLNVFMVQTIAIFAGQGIATTQDKTRACLVIDKLVASPCYVNYTWTHSMLGTSDYHSAVDQPVAEGLYFAYLYRVELGLSAGTISAINTILTINHASSYVYNGETLNNDNSYGMQNLAKWQTNRITYGYLLGNTALGTKLSNGIKRCVYYMSTAFGAIGGAENTTVGLFSDFGWRYVDSMEFHSLEYGEMSLGALLLYYPEIATPVALTAAEKLKIQAWQRQTMGMWLKNGYPNWDTGWSNGRMHSLSYWLWSLRALIGVARDSELNMNSTDAAHAKAILDHSIDTLQYMDGWNSDASGDYSDSRAPFGVNFPTGVFEGTIKYNNVKESGMAKFCMELAMAVEYGVADAASTEPTNLWGWNWYSQDVHISTPYYSAASVPWSPDITYSGSDAVQGPGDGISRLQLPTNEILTNLGGYNQEAFSFKIVRNGSTEINTGSITAGHPTNQEIWRDGVAQTRTSYDTQTIPTGFDSSIKSLVKRTGTNYRSEVETEFFNQYITWTHRAILTGTAGTGQAVISFPCVKNCVMEYTSVAGVKTTIWNGATVVAAGSPDPTACRYIHLKWAQWNAGILLIPTVGTVTTGAKVTASSTYPSSYPSRQPNQDRTLLIYLADSAASMGSVNLTYDVKFTDGTDADAAAVLNAARPFGRVPKKKTTSLRCVGTLN